MIPSSQLRSAACVALLIGLAGTGCRDVAAPPDAPAPTVPEIALVPGGGAIPAPLGLQRILERPQLALPQKAVPRHDVVLRHRRQPRPIPGGFQVPGGPFLHVFVPGPASIGGMGPDVEPNVITDFRGSSAVAFLTGEARDRQGNVYDMLNDIRVFEGEYVDLDGRRQHGTFAFV